MLVDRLSIQSKIVLMLLSVSIASILVISSLGYANGRAALTAAVENQLSGMRETRSNQIENLLSILRNQALTLAVEEGTIRAMKAFKDAYHDLASRKIEPEWDRRIEDFYNKDFLPKLAKNVDVTPVAENYLPRTIPARYLQYWYLASNPESYADKEKFDAAQDDSQYTVLHRAYHPRFRDIVQKFQFEDLLLIDAASGDVVYSMQKATDFATNLRTGPYSETPLAGLVLQVRRAMDRGEYKFADFEFYRPNLGLPSAFLACPIFDGPKMVGILALQFPLQEVNRVMNGNGEWDKEGLGQTGETYLVGSDLKIRSRTRGFHQHRDTAIESLKRAGLDARTLERVKSMHTLVLSLPVRTEAVKQAISGRTDIGMLKNYLDVPVLSAYAPLEVEGMRWAIVAEMELDEAYAPIRAFGRKVMAYSAGIIVVVTLLAILLANWILRPIERLIQGAKEVGEGKVDVEVRVKSHDEFRALADAFNEMTRSLRAKSETIEQKIRENETLLLNILPGPIAARRREGDERASEGFADVTVLFADFAGFTELSESVDPEQAVTLLNELVGAIDEAAERTGVEKVKTVGSSYMAVCGLSVQRPDHTNRMVEFAAEVLRIVRRFNQEHGASLAAEVGINAGPVVGGIVGRSKFIYDLWGDTVNVARGIKLGAAPNSIIVTRNVKDRLRDTHEFESLGEVAVAGKAPIAAWVVKD